MLKKQQVLTSIQELPDTFSIEDVIDRLVLLQKIEISLEQSASGTTLTIEAALTRLKTNGSFH